MNKILGTIEVAVLLLSVFFGYKWATHPDGNYEPWLFLGGLAFVAIEIIRRYRRELLGKEGRFASIIPWIKHWLNKIKMTPNKLNITWCLFASQQAPISWEKSRISRKSWLNQYFDESSPGDILRRQEKGHPFIYDQFMVRLTGQ